MEEPARRLAAHEASVLEVSMMLDNQTVIPGAIRIRARDVRLRARLLVSDLFDTSSEQPVTRNNDSTNAARALGSASPKLGKAADVSPLKPPAPWTIRADPRRLLHSRKTRRPALPTLRTPRFIDLFCSIGGFGSTRCPRNTRRDCSDGFGGHLPDFAPPRLRAEKSD